MPIRLLAQLDRHAAERPDAPAVSLTASRDGAAAPQCHDLDWHALSVAVQQLADRLAADLPPGAVLLLCTTNRPEFTVAFLSGLRAGLRVFPVSPSLADAELAAAAAQSVAAGIIGTAESIAATAATVGRAWRIEEILDLDPDEEPLPPRDLERSALLLLSSGTTGAPKIVVRSGGSLDAVSEAMAISIGMTTADQVLACVPLCHSYGIEHGLLAPLWAGSAVRLCPGFALPTVMAELEAGATIFPGVPFIYETLARQAAGRRYPRLRRAYSAGGPLPDVIRQACLDSLGVHVTQLYGATEIGSVTYSDPQLPGFDAGSVGRAMRGVDLRIVAPAAETAAAPLPLGAEGQIAVRADSMFDGYLDGSNCTWVDGYFATGDLGRIDAFGNLTISGRLKLLIDVAGLKVNPLEVEAVLGAHPAVSACVVMAMPITPTVSRLKAIIVRNGGDQTSGEKLRLFLRARLASYKVPRMFEFRDDLPRSAAGKILRQQAEP